MLNALALTILVLQSPVQFDLICVGQMTSGGTHGSVRTRDLTERYRVDLSAMLWCADDCDDIKPIIAVSPGYLTLADASEPDGTYLRSNINRVSGELSMSAQIVQGEGNVIYLTQRSTCQRAAFTPLPVPRF